MLGILVLSTNVYAQGSDPITVRGKVTDTNNEAIISGSVVVKGTTNGAATDIDGNYELQNVPSNATLVFSYLGFKTLEIPVNGRTTINLVMEEDAILLGEVIAIGYATGSQRTVSGTIERIGREDMNVGVVNSPLDALKGKVAGVNISKVGGDPAAGTTIRLRGTTSLTGGNDPLVIVDGVFADLGLLNALSPGDIESFTILKDASETAQYGSRGASGVIVVTTQKGKFNSKTLSYEGTFGIESAYKNIKMLDGEGFRQAVKDFGIVNALDGGANTDFIKEMQRTGYTQNHRVSFGGGSEDANYRASLGVIDTKGIIKNNYSRTYTAKIDLSQFFFDKRIQLESGIFGSKNEKQYVNDYQKTFYSAAGMNPTLPTTQNADGTWPEDVNALNIDNPLGRLSIDDKENNAYITAHARLSWNIIDGLKLSAFGSYTYNEKENSIYVPNNIKQGIRESGGHARKAEAKTESLMGNITLNYKKSTGLHYFDILGLLEGQEYKYHGFEANARGFSTNYLGYDNLKGGALVNYRDVSSYNNGYKLFSYMGRFNYVYNDRYIATVNLRSDGSSKLGKNHKWGFFPSVSAAWVISEENFMEEVSSVNNLKLRLSYGVTGNQDAIAVYNSLRLYEPQDVTTDASGNKIVTYAYNRNENPDLKWETKRTFDVGLDASFLDDRISLTFDYYRSKTVDLLYEYNVPVPPFVHTRLLANMGEMENNGFEVSVKTIPIRTNDMELSFTPNFAYQKNKLVSLTGTYKGQVLTPESYMSLGGISGTGSIGGNTNVTYHFPGQPLGVFYLPKSNGLIDNGFGDYSYNVMNLDDDPTISTDNGKDRYIAGQSMPKFYLGANIAFRYKDFDIQTQLNGAFGHKIYNGTSLSYMDMSVFPTYNVLADAPKMNIRDNTVTDFWLEKGDYLNIAYVSLGYNINTEKFKNWVKSIRVTASVNNLYTFTGYSGLSPMINSSEVNDNLGIDDKRFYPLTRTYSIGLSLNF